MNPASKIKLIDIVTLLFLTLLVVIIIFITLQRNIKRYKLRNIKDPHFHICKSIPKELKDHILAKHESSKIYREPSLLFTQSYHYLSTEQTQLFVLRLRAYDTAKELESVLDYCGFKREVGQKFEDFLIDLIQRENNLPKNLLKQFVSFYKWILIDPKVFKNDDLRNMNLLINKIIYQLSDTYEDSKILDYLLILEANNDYNIEMKLNSNDTCSNKNQFIENKINHGNDSNKESSFMKIFKRVFKTSKTGANADKSNRNEDDKKYLLNQDRNKDRWPGDESMKTFHEDSEDVPLVFKGKKESKI